jgi:hypothetical protein
MLDDRRLCMLDYLETAVWALTLAMRTVGKINEYCCMYNMDSRDKRSNKKDAMKKAYEGLS